ncbi:hypothetical protein [Streptomyces sp. NBC_00996]|nr:hypothetical protein OG390_02235 [Streptomyces sp. NBC_00996]
MPLDVTQGAVCLGTAATVLLAELAVCAVGTVVRGRAPRRDGR